MLKHSANPVFLSLLRGERAGGRGKGAVAMPLSTVRWLLLVLGTVLLSASPGFTQTPEILHVPEVASFLHQPTRLTWPESSNGERSRKWQESSRGDDDEREERPRPGPNVPEPMVFDLIRPLGVRQGELEANVLGFIPFRRVKTRTPQFSFITGADQSTKKRTPFEWAPEIEYGVFDNFAVEFELPMSLGQVEAFKLAAQYTFGTGFDEQFIHGIQGILFIDRTNGAVTPTLLYLTALRFDPVYSLQTMLGFSHEFGSDNPMSPTLILFNLAVFAELDKLWTVGFETNYIADLDGTAGLLFMPQVHWNPTEKFTLQVGVGTRAQEGSFIGEGVFRVIQEF